MLSELINGLTSFLLLLVLSLVLSLIYDEGAKSHQVLDTILFFHYIGSMKFLLK